MPGEKIRSTRNGFNLANHLGQRLRRLFLVFIAFLRAVFVRVVVRAVFVRVVVRAVVILVAFIRVVVIVIRTHDHPVKRRHRIIGVCCGSKVLVDKTIGQHEGSDLRHLRRERRALRRRQVGGPRGTAGGNGQRSGHQQARPMASRLPVRLCLIM